MVGQMKEHEHEPKTIGSRSISIFTRSTIPRTISIIPRISFWSARASSVFGALAITLHDKVFDRPEVFADAAAMGILLMPAAEMRLEGADVVLLNVQPARGRASAHLC